MADELIDVLIVWLIILLLLLLVFVPGGMYL